MKNNSHFRNKSEKLTYIDYGFLLLCFFLTSYVPKTWAKDGFMNLQSTYVTLNLIDVSFETLFKTLEKKSDYVFFLKKMFYRKMKK